MPIAAMRSEIVDRMGGGYRDRRRPQERNRRFNFSDRHELSADRARGSCRSIFALTLLATLEGASPN